MAAERPFFRHRDCTTSGGSALPACTKDRAAGNPAAGDGAGSPGRYGCAAGPDADTRRARHHPQTGHQHRCANGVRRSPRPVLALQPEPAAPAASFSVPAAAPPAPATDVAPAMPAPAVTPVRFEAAYLHNPRPDYPPLSRRLGEEGKVLLRVRVSREGRPAAVDLEKSSNFRASRRRCPPVVAHWRFVPARRGDEAIDATVIVPIVFRLEG